jgi:hypothetical protein
MYVAILLVVVLDLCGNLLLEKMDALCLTPIFCQIGSLKSVLFIEKPFCGSFFRVQRDGETSPRKWPYKILIYMPSGRLFNW